MKKKYRFNRNVLYQGIMDLQFLNELKKGDKELRREQNKRYREKYREILNLKKQRAYHKENFEKKRTEK